MVGAEYSAESELRRPERFARAAMADLRLAPLPAWRLFGRQLRIRHRRAFLGYLWLVLPAVAAALLSAFVRAQRIVEVGPTSLPYPLFVLAGVLFWQIFTDGLTAPLSHLGAARGLLSRSRLPHEAVLLAGVLDVGFGAAVRLVVLMAAVTLWGTPIAATAALVPLAALGLLLLGFAIGLALAPVGLLYDDVQRGIAMAAGFGVFLTPVFYPIRHEGLLALNPVTPLLVTGRGWLTGEAPAPGFGAVTVAALVLLIAAWLIYRAARPYLVERMG